METTDSVHELLARDTRRGLRGEALLGFRKRLRFGLDVEVDRRLQEPLGTDLGQQDKLALERVAGRPLSGMRSGSGGSDAG